MTAPIRYQSSATIGTSERSLPSDTTTSVPKATTDEGELSFVIDGNALLAGDEFLITLYETISGGTQRVWDSWTITDVTVKLWSLPPGIVVKEGWDLTAKKISGTDRSLRWRGVLRAVTPDVNVTLVDGAALSTHQSGHFPSDLRYAAGTILGTAAAGYVPSDTRKHNGTSPSNLSAGGNYPADVEEVNASNTAGSTTVPKRLTAAGEFKVKDDGGNAVAPASATTAIQADTDDIQTRLPAALTGAGNMKSDALAIDGSTAAATALSGHAIADTDPWDAAGGGGGGITFPFQIYAGNVKFQNAINQWVFFVQSSLINSAETDALVGETGLVVADFTVQVDDNDTTFADVLVGGLGGDYLITEIGDGWYRLILLNGIGAGDSSNAAAAQVTYTPSILPDGYMSRIIAGWGWKMGDLPIAADLVALASADELDARHGQGQWGPSYPLSQLEANALSGWGNWNHGHLCDDAGTQDSALWGGLNLPESGTPTYQNAGVLGSADSAFGVSVAGHFVAASAANLNVDATQDIAFIIPVNYDVLGEGGQQYLMHKPADIGDSGGGYIVRIGTSGGGIFVEFEALFGSNNVTGRVNLPVGDPREPFVVGCALSRATSMLRLGIRTKGGVSKTSRLIPFPVEVIGQTLETSIALRMGEAPGGAVTSHVSAWFAAYGVNAALGVPEHLDDVLRRWGDCLFRPSFRASDGIVDSDQRLLDGGITSAPEQGWDFSKTADNTTLVGISTREDFAGNVAHEWEPKWGIEVIGGLCGKMFRYVSGGWSEGGFDSIEADTDFTIWTNGAGNSEVREFGFAVASQSDCVEGDRFRVTREGDDLKAYRVRGGVATLIYTEADWPAFLGAEEVTFVAVGMLKTRGLGTVDAQVSTSEIQRVTWESSTGGVAVDAHAAAIDLAPVTDQLTTIEGKVDTLQVGLDRALGLLHKNSRVDRQQYDASGNLTSARLRVFASKAARAASTAWDNATSLPANGAEGEIQRYTISAVYTGGKLVSFSLDEDL